MKYRHRCNRTFVGPSGIYLFNFDLLLFRPIPLYCNEKFRNYAKLLSNNTDFYQNLSLMYERWLKSLEMTNFEDLRKLFLLEQYLSCMPVNLKLICLKEMLKVPEKLLEFQMNTQLFLKQSLKLY